MTRKIFYIFLSWRMGLFIVAFISGLLISFGNKFPYAESLLFNSHLPKFIWSFANFDGVHYLTIAKSGYAANFTQVFFPLYPILMRTLNILINNYVLSGLIISNLAFFLSLVLFYKLLKLDFDDNKIINTILLFIIFPTSFYFGSIYTESLFFLFVIASFYSARKNNWLLAGFFGFLASLTRFFGVFLLPALLIECYLQKRSLRSVIPLMLIPIGLSLYMLYLKTNFNDPLFFIHAQPVFGAQRTSGDIILFPQVVFRYIKILLSVNPLSLPFFNALFEFIVSILFLFLSLAALIKTRLSYSIFSFVAYIIPTLTGTFSSMPRYVLILFPCFIIIGQLKSSVLKNLIYMIFLSLMITSIILFTSGYWVA